MYEDKNIIFGLNLKLRFGIRVSSVVTGKVKVRFKIRFYDFVSVVSMGEPLCRAASSA
jgi:hypothetical protein